MKISILLALAAMAGMASIPKPPPKPLSDREKVIAVATSQVGVTEKTGNNDGEVEKYIASVGENPKSKIPYCACFNYWCGKEALGKSPYPKSAWSPDHVKGGTRVTATSPIKGGEAFGIYFGSKGRVAHTGLSVRREGGNIITAEANTSGNAAVGSAADRDGQGVFMKRRPWRTVYSVKDWIGGPN